MAAEKRDPMSADLLRQRRNLLITSLALTAIDLAGAKLKQDVSVLGASLEFSNPERIVWGAWILWAYFLMRYWQYLNEEPNFGIHEGMRRWILKRFPQDEFDEFRQWIFWSYGILWSLRVQHKDWEEEHWSPSSRDPKSTLRKALWTFRAFLSVATKTPRFTDYLVPFFVASIPLILSIWSFLVSRSSATT